MKPDTFRREIARARTFGFMRDVASLWNAGYALGASLENTLVVTDNRILNPEGMRFPDEFVRHKVLDAVGDLALAGAPLLATYRSVRGGHKLNHAVLSRADVRCQRLGLGRGRRPPRCAAMPTWPRSAPPRPSGPTSPDIQGLLGFSRFWGLPSATLRAECPPICCSSRVLTGLIGRRGGRLKLAGDGVHPLHGWGFAHDHLALRHLASR